VTRLLAVALSAVLALSHPVFAEGKGDDIAALLRALDISGTVDVMQEEGLVYGDDIAGEMLPEVDADNWAQTVRRIYDRDNMQRLIEEEMAQALNNIDVTPLLSFYQSDAGQLVVQMELDARRAFMSSETEDAAAVRLENAMREGAPVVSMVETIISDSDLIEMNVAGALNSNLMFYRGLAEGGAWEMSEDDMLRDVWAQEEATRKDTQDWLMSFLVMAYTPMNEDALDTYAALFRTDEGRALNRALFQSFNRMYDELSYLLGRAVAVQLTSAPL